VTAILTNPIWVVKVRTFTAPLNSPAAHRGLLSGFRAIFRDEGLGGLYRGTSLALFGVSNGALQFMGYEKMKNWAFERKRRRVAKLGRAWTTDDDKLSNTAYTIMSGASKLGALCATYPYQVIRSRIQRLLYVGRLGAGAHAPSHDHVDDRAYVGARGPRGVLSRFGYEPRARAPWDVRHLRRVRKYRLAAQARCRETRGTRRGQSVVHL